MPKHRTSNLRATMNSFLMVHCILLSFVTFGSSYLLTTTSVRKNGNRLRYFESSQIKMATTPFRDSLRNSPLVITSYRHAQKTIAEIFIEKWNDNRIREAMELVDHDIEFENADFPGPFVGENELERTLRLLTEIPNRSGKVVVEDVANDDKANKMGVRFHTIKSDGSFDKKGAASFTLDPDSGLIKRVFWVTESNKSGEANLKLLSRATALTDVFKSKDKIQTTQTSTTSDDVDAGLSSLTTPNNPPRRFFPKATEPFASSMTLPEQYFAAWNDRDMAKACSLFSESCEYDDTAFPAPFEGKQALEKHLKICADSFPPTFEFCIVDQIIGNNNILVQWHVENNGEKLFFTRGCSFYNIHKGKITKGIDIVEPAIFKPGGIFLAARSIASKLSTEPIRILPLVTWIAYMYVVFFSDWFYGYPATALEQRTWEEVRDLSLNFFLVSPILHLPFAPVVHPMLEGVFNLLLSWAALFAGFLSDDRPKKPQLLPMVPIVAGMQFLTSAFLLPYLVCRSNEPADVGTVYTEDLGQVTLVTESRLLAPFLTVVGSGSILWGIYARATEFGGFNERLSSFLQMLSIDRVGSSFVVDLAIFSAFQGWLVEDDVKRRGMDSSSSLVTVAKLVPFFGMAAYLTFRDPLPTKEEVTI